MPCHPPALSHALRAISCGEGAFCVDAYFRGRLRKIKKRPWMKPWRDNGPPAGRDAGPLGKYNVPEKRGLFYRWQEPGFGRTTLTLSKVVVMAVRNERSDGIGTWSRR